MADATNRRDRSSTLGRVPASDPGTTTTSKGAPKRGEARQLWQEHRTSAAAGTLVARTLSETPLTVTVREILDFFGKCPRCGYPAQAIDTVRTYRSGRVDHRVRVTCGLPCGWEENSPQRQPEGSGNSPGGESPQQPSRLP